MHSERLISGRIPPLLVCALLASLASLPAQERASEPSQPRPHAAEYVPTMLFDVASVRENKTFDPNGSFVISGAFTPDTTVFRVTNFTIENLLELAYGVDRNQIAGLPKWPFPTLFTIQAKSDSAADTKMASLTPERQAAEHAHMLQALLQQRFNLKTHWTTREGDMYRLVPAKNGPRLSPDGSMQRTTEETETYGAKPIPPIYQKNDQQGYDFVAHGCSMQDLAQTLAVQFGRPVIDETKLTGNYDFVLKYKGRWDSDRDAADLDTMPPLDRALQEQIGLKVETTKGPIKTLVIDHIEKPSEN